MNRIKALSTKAFMLLALTLTGGGGLLLTSCSDEPDSEHFYTFTGEMMSDYLKNRPQYSEFAAIVERAKLMDLLATYGQYTCFLPSNDAVNKFLSDKGLQSIDQLSDADCDTIARTHLVANMYSTFEMNQDRLTTSNMLGRYLATSQGVDSDSNAVVYLEGIAHIIFEQTLEDGTVVHQNDSVENGIVQPIDMVIEKSNSYIADILRDNPKISIFYEALVATGVREQILLVDDPSYDKNQPKYRYKSHTWQEVAWVPSTKKYGFTAFVEPDSVYMAKFEEYGISTGSGSLRALYDLACQIYDPVFPDDVNASGHSFENLTDSVNPLHRFMQYHIMTRYVPGTSDLTALVCKETKEAFGFDSKLINPIDWYQTLLPHTMLKIEQLTMARDEKGNDCRGEDVKYVSRHFINRRYAAPEYTFRGALVDNTVEKEPVHDALNGHYFYVDDLVVFSYDVQNKVQNQRIRMDFSTVWPEVMTNDMRLKGNYTVDDNASTPDDSNEPKNGKNYYFPEGYLDGVTINNNGYLVMRRPHCNFWSWQGDEWNLFGDYDMTFRIPPVPYSGDWQMRLGYCAIETRGVMQSYFDGVPQGIPVDMTRYLNTETYLGDRYVVDESLGDYKKKTDEEKAEEQKTLKNLGVYRDGRSQYHFSSGGSKYYFLGNERTHRKIVYQGYVDATKDHYVRFRVASDGKQGNNNEFMFDFWEMVPKSVYGVDGDGAMEDDL
ncbi:MAG: fasciclin domain-containing protein [Prevotella sp.]|nr:fasciclin domain-containing protein [Prevotella sp.]